MAELVFYETVERDNTSPYPLITAHDTLKDAVQYAEAHALNIIYQNGGDYWEFEKCPRCKRYHPNIDFDDCKWYAHNY